MVSFLTRPAGSLLSLKGSGAYDAAVHCAAVSACRRGGLVPAPPCPAEKGDKTQQSLIGLARRLKSAVSNLFLRPGPGAG